MWRKEPRRPALTASFESNIRFGLGLLLSLLSLLVVLLAFLVAMLSATVGDVAWAGFWLLALGPIVLSALIARRRHHSISDWLTLAISAYVGFVVPWLVVLFVVFVTAAAAGDW